VDSRLHEELVELARSAIAQEVEARGWQFDVSQVEMLRQPEPHDLDGDGRDEFCFVAGIPTYGGPAWCGLCVPSKVGDYDVRALHECEAGFRDMFVSDTNKDGVPEVVTLWQEDFGLYLTLHIQQCDGNSVRSLFPRQRFHQGVMEMKDLDADGLDEILIWSGIYETNPRWGPQFFAIHVFQYNGRMYELQRTSRSTRRYLPATLLGQAISFTGLPEQFELPPPPAEQRRRVEERIAMTGRIEPEILGEIGNQSIMFRREGFYEEAIELVDLVLETIEHVSDQQAQLVLEYEAWSTRAFICTLLGRWQEAIDAYREAIDLYDRGASARVDPKFGPTRRRELGMVYFRVGEYGEALRWFSDAAAALEEASLPDDEYRDELARIRSNSGLAYVELGQYGPAKKALRQGVSLHEALGRLTQATISRTALGNALREEARARDASYAASIRTYEAALSTLYGQDGGDDESKDRESDVYLELGRTLLLDQNPGRALYFLEKSLLLTSVSNLTQHAAEHYLYIGEAHADLGTSASAERFLSKAAMLAEEYGTPDTRWRALHKLVLVQKADGRITECEQTLARCIDTIERLRSQYLPEATKISMLSAKERPYADMVALLCRSEPGRLGHPDAQAIKEAFNYVERAKSRVFAEQLAETDLGSAGVPAELLEQERKLAQDLRRLQARHRAEVEPQKYDWSSNAVEVEDKLRRIQEEFRETGAKGREYVALRQASPLDYDAVRGILSDAEIPDGAARIREGRPTSRRRFVLAEYFTTDEKVLLFIGRGDFDTPKLHQFDITQEDLWRWRRIVFEELEHPSDWDLSEWQAQLGPLIEPIARWSEEGDAVWIVPHGDLHRLPLHSLKVGDDYLIERNPVFYAPSASTMKYCENKGTGQWSTALVFGDSLGDLQYAEEEARVVADLFEVDPCIGSQATKPVLKVKINELHGSVDILHFACHGRFESGEPLKSCILLAPLQGSAAVPARCVEDRDLTAEEILDLEIRANLVTLSACESGISERHPGDELIGLTRSLIYAGAPSVVVSLWRVDDESTSILMGQFYRNLLAMEFRDEYPLMGKAQALQQAQRHVIELSGSYHPFYWAPFVLVGHWT
jgi:tetratricopeptide (TPR) repeat protein